MTPCLLQISYTEFLAALLVAHEFLTEEHVFEAFDNLDEDNNGFISLDDLQAILGQDLDLEIANEILASADLGKDGRVSREELLQFIRRRQDDLAEAAMSKLENNERQLLS